MQPDALADTYTVSEAAHNWLDGRLTYQSPMEVLQHRVAHKREVNGRQTGSPHQQYNTAKVQSIAKRCGRRRKIPYNMAAVVICVS